MISSETNSFKCLSVVHVPCVKCSKSCTPFNIFSVNFLPFGKISLPRSFLTPCAVLPLTNANNFSINLKRKASYLASKSRSSSSILTLSCAVLRRSLIERVKSFLSITTPRNDGEAFNDASLTSPALSPNIALKSFSSGVGSDSPLGVTLPIKISPGLTSAPIRIIPFSSKSLVASSLTFGISLVNSSCPNLVSRTSKACSTICKDVK